MRLNGKTAFPRERGFCRFACEAGLGKLCRTKLAHQPRRESRLKFALTPPARRLQRRVDRTLHGARLTAATASGRTRISGPEARAPTASRDICAATSRLRHRGQSFRRPRRCLRPPGLRRVCASVAISGSRISADHRRQHQIAGDRRRPSPRQTAVCERLFMTMSPAPSICRPCRPALPIFTRTDFSDRSRRCSSDIDTRD